MTSELYFKMIIQAVCGEWFGEEAQEGKEVGSSEQEAPTTSSSCSCWVMDLEGTRDVA